MKGTMRWGLGVAAVSTLFLAVFVLCQRATDGPFPFARSKACSPASSSADACESEHWNPGDLADSLAPDHDEGTAPLERAGAEAEVPVGGLQDRWYSDTVEVIASTEVATSEPNVVQRVRIIEVDDFKHPLIRTEETIERDPLEGDEWIHDRVEMVADHVMVQLHEEQSEHALAQIAEMYGATVRRKMTVPGMYLVAFEGGDVHALPAALDAFGREVEAIAFAEPDYIVHVAETVPDDARFDALWGMHNTGQTGGAEDADIDAVEAWDQFRGSRRVLVGVIDTGVDRSHPDLAENMWVNPVRWPPTASTTTATDLSMIGADGTSPTTTTIPMTIISMARMCRERSVR